MNSRSKILSAINKNKPSMSTEVDLSQFLEDSSQQEIVNSFCANVIKNEGRIIIPENENELKRILENETAGKKFIDYAGILDECEGRIDPSQIKDPKAFEQAKVLIIPGILGVAENAAVWWDDNTVSGNRILPFIVEHSIILINKKGLVPTMHHAYHHLGKIETGFGCFIAGPSKTGDIEQTLVTGAQGALSHLVLLM